MANSERAGTYRALPEIDDQIREFVLTKDSGPVRQFAEALRELGPALQKIDEEMTSLAQANPNLADIVRGMVEGTYSVFADMLVSEQYKAYLRAIAYVNSLVVLRALDLQWREREPG